MINEELIQETAEELITQLQNTVTKVLSYKYYKYDLSILSDGTTEIKDVSCVIVIVSFKGRMEILVSDVDDFKEKQYTLRF